MNSERKSFSAGLSSRIVTTFTFFVLVFTILTTFTFSFLHFRQEKALEDQLHSGLKVYASTISEKVSVLVSSDLFLDFIRSGSLTRNELEPDIDQIFSNLIQGEIKGAKILDLKGRALYAMGEDQEYQVILDLCYLNRTLNSELGKCLAKIELFFDPKELLANLRKLNPRIQDCTTCAPQGLISNQKFGTFKAQESAPHLLRITIEDWSSWIILIPIILAACFTALTGLWLSLKTKKDIEESFWSPLQEIISGIEDGEPIQEKDSYFSEIKFLVEQINDWKLKASKLEHLKKEAALSELASQVAHDIRSPLSVLEVMIASLKNVPENHRNLIQAATKRIRDIANVLLNRHKVSLENALLPLIDLPSLIQDTLEEKRIEFNGKIDIQFTFHNIVRGPAFIKTIPFELKRVLSNLINNSVDAIRSPGGEITLTLQEKGKFFDLELRDNGVGIPIEIQGKLFNKGASFSKEGTGLGLYSAKKFVEILEGQIRLESKLGYGTSLFLSFPKYPSPSWSLTHLELSKNSCLAVIDDDESFFHLWQNKLQEIEIDLKYIPKPSQLKASQVFDTYLMDYDFGPTEMNGLDAISHLALFNQVILVTSRAQDPIIQKRCEELQVKLISKSQIHQLKVLALNSQ